MMLIVAFEVVMRYIFSCPTIWALEVNQTLLCIYSALAGGYTLLHQGHVNVEIVYQHFGTKTRLVIDILTYFLFFGFIIILLWQTWDMAVDSAMIKERSESLFGLPLYPAKISIVMGTLLILLQGIANFLRKVIALITGVEPPRPPNIFEKLQK
ncbi:MAG TPA: TRAP transporter small permease subunit [Desulfobacterales bacterium]|nr:TRAP transporter small permease subunit [Desulfobacterales bacterium]